LLLLLQSYDNPETERAAQINEQLVTIYVST
jgi:hypothetical protein